MPKVGDRVRSTDPDEGGCAGCVGVVETVEKSHVWMCVEQTGDCQATAGVMCPYQIEELEPAPRIREDGTLDLPVRSMIREKYDRTLEGLGPKDWVLLHNPNGNKYQSFQPRGIARVHDGRLYWSEGRGHTWYPCYVNYTPGDEQHMEWIVREE